MMLPPIHVDRDKLNARQLQAIAVAIQFTECDQERGDEIQSLIDTALSHTDHSVFVAAGQLLPMLDAQGQVSFFEGTAFGKSTDLTEERLPDFTLGYMLVSDGDDLLQSGHLPPELSPVEKNRLFDAYRNNVAGATDQDAEDFVELIAEARLHNFLINRVIHGHALLQLGTHGKLDYLEVKAIPVEEQKAYAEARVQAGLVRKFQEFPISEEDMIDLCVHLGPEAEVTCSGDHRRTLEFLKSRGIPVLAAYQWLVKSYGLCDGGVEEFLRAELEVDPL